MLDNPNIEISAIPALQDNYIWAIHDDRRAAVVDPGDAAPVLAFLDAHHLRLDAILCTHRHNDHIGGIAGLREVYNVPVYGRPHPKNPHITNALREGDKLELEGLGVRFDIIEIPGHVDDHIAFLAPDIVFCGDVLFGAGCGRNFEGTKAELLHSLQRLARLPDTTRIYCAHEYTSANLNFALACDPDNPEVKRRIATTRQLRAANQITLPSTIAIEKATNPFLRCTQPGIIRTLQARGLIGSNGSDISELGVFTAMREWKNHF